MLLLIRAQNGYAAGTDQLLDVNLRITPSWKALYGFANGRNPLANSRPGGGFENQDADCSCAQVLLVLQILVGCYEDLVMVLFRTGNELAIE